MLDSPLQLPGFGYMSAQCGQGFAAQRFDDSPRKRIPHPTALMQDTRRNAMQDRGKRNAGAFSCWGMTPMIE
jgi:hypothetical protein